MKSTHLVLAFSLCGVRFAHADDKKPACPAAVTSAVAKAYPDGTVSSCKHEVEDGHEQFEVKLTRKAGGMLELDVSPDGKILQTEEQIELKDVPDAVTKAFAAKYPKAKATRAERELHADGNTYYELGFVGGKGKKQEATFAADGKFVEEE
jgi:hypothetical protein